MFMIFYCIDNKLLKTKVRMIQISGLVEHVKIQEADKAKGQAHSHMSLKVDKWNPTHKIFTTYIDWPSL